MSKGTNRSPCRPIGNSNIDRPIGLFGINGDQATRFIFDVDFTVTTGVHIHRFQFHRHIGQSHIVGDGNLRIGGVRQDPALSGIHDMPCQRNRPTTRTHGFDDQGFFLLAVNPCKVIIWQGDIGEVLARPDSILNKGLLSAPQNQIKVFLTRLNKSVYVDIFSINRDRIGQQIGCIGVNAQTIEPGLHCRQRGRVCAVRVAQKRTVGEENPNRIAAYMLHKHAKDIDRILGLDEDLSRLDLTQDIDRATFGRVDDIQTRRWRDNITRNVDALARRDKARVGINKVVDIGDRNLDLRIGLSGTYRCLREVKRNRPVIDILGAQVVIRIIGQIIAIYVPAVFCQDERCRRIFIIRCDVSAVKIHPTIEGWDCHARDFKLRVGVVLDLDPRIFWRVKKTTAAARQII